MPRVNNKKKEMENAQIKASLVKNKTLSLKRLLHDYEEIKNQVIPIPGVSALPLGDNMYEWHGNIKSLVNNIYKGAVLHFRFSFPKDYPLSPPSVYLLNNNFTHPNVMEGGRICLDMFEKQGKSYKGWKTGYTILSILLQLQSFFFEVDENFLTEEHKIKIKEQLISMNEFKCPECKHRGSSNPFPDFPQKTELNTQLTVEQYKEAKKEEICCYHIKEHFTKVPIGLGVNISKIPRTGEINSIIPCFDFISLKAYSKERLRVSFEGRRFTHWFPLYFGEEDKKDKFLNSATKAISMIVKGTTKEFTPDLIAKVMYKFFGSCCLTIIKENVHNSSRALEILIYVYRILIILVKNCPEFKEEVNKKIENFIKIPEKRNKKDTPSLNDLLVMLSISDYKIEDLLPSYISEQLDRQIFWILKELPQLEELINSSDIDDIRAKVCFKAAITGQQLLLLYYYLLKKIVYSECESLDKFAEKLDKNYGCLTETEIDKHRKEINNILKIDNFNDFYKFLDMKPPTKEELNEQLKQAFENSKIKKYHGFDEERFVPSPEKQIEIYMKKYESFDNLFENGKLLDAENPKWQELIKTFDIVKQYKYNYPKKKLEVIDIVKYAREKIKEKLFFEVKSEENNNVNNNTIPLHGGRGGRRFNGRGRGGRGFGGRGRGGYINNAMNNVYDNRLINTKNKKESKINKRKFVKYFEDEEIIKKLNWRQLYLKFYLEEYCKYFHYIGDFKLLYKILDNVKEDIIHFSFFISDFGILRSDYNFIRAILSRLTSLKYLELIFTKDINIKLLKNLEKGIANNLKEKGSIEHLKIIKNPHNYNYSTKELNVLTILDNMPSLKILDVSGVSLDMNLVQRIKNHLYYYKKIKILDLSYCNLDDQMCNDLADGIMKAKSLEKLYIAGNNMVKGLSSILYNLAFQPAIKFIDISNNKSCDKKETSISLQKKLK